MRRSKQVSFAASEEMYDALEILAYETNATIATTLRRIISQELIEGQFLDPRAPLTEQTAASNSRYVPKSARRDPRPAGGRP